MLWPKKGCFANVTMMMKLSSYKEEPRQWRGEVILLRSQHLEYTAATGRMVADLEMSRMEAVVT
jgi:hypothetical protein